MMRCLALLLFASPAWAQPAASTRTLSLLTITLPYVGDAGLHKELGLTAEQIKNLTEFRQQLWDEDYKLASKEIDARSKDRVALVEKRFIELLNPAQLARFREISWQLLDEHLDRSGAGDYIRNMPDVIAILKLTDQQQALLRGYNPNVWTILTPQQRSNWIERLGKPCDAPPRAQVDARVPVFSIFRPGDLAVLRDSGVRRELKLSPEQVEKLDALLPRGRASADTGVSAEKARQHAAETMNLVRPQIGRILTPDQLKRFHQIVLRLGPGKFGLVSLLNANPPVPQLRLSPEQVKDLAAIATERRETLRKLALSDEPIEELRKHMRAACDAMDEKAGGVLTVGQRLLVAELVGDPYTVRLAGPASKRGPRVAFGLYSMELGYLQQLSVQEELKLDEDQIKQADDAWSQFREEFSKPAEAGGQRAEAISDFTKKAIAAILKPHQLRRLREIAMQQKPKSGTQVALIHIIAYPDVATELNLSAEQIDALKSGDDPDKVLTVGEREQARKLLGEKFAKQLLAVRLPIPAIAAPAPPTLLRHLRERSVLRDLKVNADQLARLEAIESRRTEMLKNFADLSTDKQRALEIQVTRTVIQALTNLLTPDQSERLAQIERQKIATQGLGTALRYPEVRGELQPTPEQLQAVTKIADRGMQVARMVGLELLGPDPALQSEIERQREERILAVFTAEQRARWKEATGDPYLSHQRGFVPPPPRP